MIPYRIIMGIVKFLAIFNAHLCKHLQQNFCDSAKRLVRCNVHQSFLNRGGLTMSCKKEARFMLCTKKATSKRLAHGLL